MLVAIVTLSALTVFCGLILGYAHLHFKVKGNPIVDQINALLPQTQCGQCGYPGCQPYAQAIAADEVDINCCPPGGEATIIALANLLVRDPKPLDPQKEEKPKALAVIDENLCIGCTLCIQACPVDAILGAPRYLHTVIVAECTGCELCVAPCPIDCIDMVPITNQSTTWKWPYPNPNIEQAQKSQKDVRLISLKY
ncbi:RnfABCDGE type electron transport complex subunit B [Candidatus Nitrosoglobus terrae]|uniref:Ion-translocating oxidoreductase complex subunit B n=1 Tax=Candidatus Nitrosoglobus terrae TaxID=1630141 RepID=A0A1Q2SML6_9GAMM|nr:electron transport complex subunit RsxB [Candidatus Nitrosoglobus terrae]BAW80362.1 RnfABCDGE type electron transport complex subunit B [Candidatus Nitrosoglobus terrae]